MTEMSLGQDKMIENQQQDLSEIVLSINNKSEIESLYPGKFNEILKLDNISPKQVFESLDLQKNRNKLF